jgi:hypothetical protein
MYPWLHAACFNDLVDFIWFDYDDYEPEDDDDDDDGASERKGDGEGGRAHGKADHGADDSSVPPTGAMTAVVIGNTTESTEKDEIKQNLTKKISSKLPRVSVGISGTLLTPIESVVEPSDPCCCTHPFNSSPVCTTCICACVCLCDDC